MKLLNLPNLRQTYNYDCGAKALQCILTYYGVEVREDKIIKETKTTQAGTYIKNIVKTAKNYNLNCISKQMTFKELKHFIDNKIPVIIVLQAWTDKENENWETNWKDGHYVVCIGYDKNKFYFEDPSSFEIDYLEYNELKIRWHDIDIKGKKYFHWGIAIYGKKHKFEKEHFIHMD